MLNHEVLFFGNGVLPRFPSTLLGTCACQQRYQHTYTMRFTPIVCIGWWGRGVQVLVGLIWPDFIFDCLAQFWGDRCAPPRTSGTRVS